MVTINNRVEIESIVKEYAELLKQEIKLDRVYLFGSYAKGTYNDNSDIDIAVVADDFTGDRFEDSLKLRKLRRRIDCRIEPHPIKSDRFDLLNPFIREIVNTGIRIM